MGNEILQNMGNKLYRTWGIKYYTEHEENVKQNIGHNVIQNMENAMLYRIKIIKCDTKQEGKCYTENWENDTQIMGNKKWVFQNIGNKMLYRTWGIKCSIENGE